MIGGIRMKYLMVLAVVFLSVHLYGAVPDTAGKTLNSQTIAALDKNIGTFVELLDTAESCLGGCRSNLLKMRDLTVLGAYESGTNEIRQALIRQIRNMADETRKILAQAQFNDLPVFKSDGDNPVLVHLTLSENDPTETFRFNRFHLLKSMENFPDSMLPTSESFMLQLPVIDGFRQSLTGEWTLCEAYRQRMENVRKYLDIRSDPKFASDKDRNSAVRTLAAQLKDYIRSLAVNGANSVYGDDQRAFLDADYQEMLKQLAWLEKQTGQDFKSKPYLGTSLVLREDCENLMRRMTNW